MIPTNLKIDPRVRPKVEEWMRARLKEKPTPEEEIDCCGSSSFTFHGYAGGIGDTWWVERAGKKFFFGVDDDGIPYTIER